MATKGYSTVADRILFL